MMRSLVLLHMLHALIHDKSSLSLVAEPASSFGADGGVQAFLSLGLVSLSCVCLYGLARCERTEDQTGAMHVNTC